MKKHSKVHISFYKGLGRSFLVLIAICSFFLGILWIGLNYYESTTQNGALIHYVNLLKNKQYEEIYEESKKVYAQYNEKEVYINYLDETFSDLDLNAIVFKKKNYTATEFEYHDVLINDQIVATLEIRKDPKKNKWNARALTEVKSYKIDTIYDHVDMEINNNVIEDGRIVANDIPSTAYENLKSPDEGPTINQYFIDNLIGVPNIILKDDTLTIVKDAILDQFYIGKIPTGEDLALYQDLIEEAATTYSMYITQDVPFSTLRKLLYTKTEFYDNIRSFNNGFFSEHDKIEFENMKLFDIVQLDEKSFIGSISFDYIVSIGNRSQTYSSTYQMTFLDTNGKGRWLLTNLVIADSQ